MRPSALFLALFTTLFAAAACDSTTDVGTPPADTDPDGLDTADTDDRSDADLNIDTNEPGDLDTEAEADGLDADDAPDADDTAEQGDEVPADNEPATDPRPVWQLPTDPAWGEPAGGFAVTPGGDVIYFAVNEWCWPIAGGETYCLARTYSVTTADNVVADEILLCERDFQVSGLRYWGCAAKTPFSQIAGEPPRPGRTYEKTDFFGRSFVLSDRVQDLGTGMTGFEEPLGHLFLDEASFSGGWDGPRNVMMTTVEVDPGGTSAAPYIAYTYVRSFDIAVRPDVDPDPALLENVSTLVPPAWTGPGTLTYVDRTRRLRRWVWTGTGAVRHTVVRDKVVGFVYAKAAKRTFARVNPAETAVYPFNARVVAVADAGDELDTTRKAIRLDTDPAGHFVSLVEEEGGGRLIAAADLDEMPLPTFAESKPCASADGKTVIVGRSSPEGAPLVTAWTVGGEPKTAPFAGGGADFGGRCRAVAGGAFIVGDTKVYRVSAPYTAAPALVGTFTVHPAVTADGTVVGPAAVGERVDLIAVGPDGTTRTLASDVGATKRYTHGNGRFVVLEGAKSSDGAAGGRALIVDTENNRLMRSPPFKRTKSDAVRGVTVGADRVVVLTPDGTKLQMYRYDDLPAWP